MSKKNIVNIKIGKKFDIDKIKKLINIREIIDYGKILIEFEDDGASVTGYFGDYKNTAYIDISESYVKDWNNEEKIKAICKIAYLINYQLNWDESKHYRYRFICGLEVNNDIDYDKIDSIVDEETRMKLQDAGFEIIKSL